MNSISMLRLLLNHKQMTLDIINGEDGMEEDTPLDYINCRSVGGWSTEAKKLFETFGAKTSFEINCPLLWQIKCENVEKVKELLQAPNNPVAVDEECIRCAAQNIKTAKIMQMLLEHHTCSSQYVNHQFTVDGETPLDLVSEGMKFGIVGRKSRVQVVKEELPKILRSKGGRRVFELSMSPLRYAVSLRDQNRVAIALRNKDANVAEKIPWRNYQGIMLYEIIFDDRKVNLKILKLLLDHQSCTADFLNGTCCDSGLTILDQVEKLKIRGYRKISKMLRECGAKSSYA